MRSAAKDALAMSSGRIADLLPNMSAADVLHTMGEFHQFIAAADIETVQHWKSDRDVWLDFRLSRKKEAGAVCKP